MHPLFPFLLRPHRILFILSKSRFPLRRAPILVRFDLPAAMCCVGTSAYAARVRFLIRVGGGGAFLAAGSTFPNVKPSKRGNEVGVLFDQRRVMIDQIVRLRLSLFDNC